MKRIQFDKICKNCGRKIYPDGTSGSWTTKRINKFGSFNCCGEVTTYPRHAPITNLEYLESIYDKRNNLNV